MDLRWDGFNIASSVKCLLLTRGFEDPNLRLRVYDRSVVFPLCARALNFLCLLGGHPGRLFIISTSFWMKDAAVSLLLLELHKGLSIERG